MLIQLLLIFLVSFSCTNEDPNIGSKRMHQNSGIEESNPRNENEENQSRKSVLDPEEQIKQDTENNESKAKNENDHRSDCAVRPTDTNPFASEVTLQVLDNLVENIEVNLYPNFNTIGIEIPAAELNEISSIKTFYREKNNINGDEWTESIELVKRPERYAGFIPWLREGESYEIAFQLTDKQSQITYLRREIATRTIKEFSAPKRVRVVSPDSRGQKFTKDDPGSLQSAIESARPGDLILLKNGTYDADNLKLTVSGEPEFPIVLRSENPKGAILSGLKILPDEGWTFDSTNKIYHMTFNEGPIRNVFWKGKRISRFESLNLLLTNKKDYHGFVVANNKLYVSLMDGIPQIYFTSIIGRRVYIL